MTKDKKIAQLEEELRKARDATMAVEVENTKMRELTAKVLRVGKI